MPELCKLQVFTGKKNNRGEYLYEFVWCRIIKYSLTGYSAWLEPIDPTPRREKSKIDYYPNWMIQKVAEFPL
jgi:hypothetical protein